jgi:hypothetical protein
MRPKVAAMRLRQPVKALGRQEVVVIGGHHLNAFLVQIVSASLALAVKRRLLPALQGSNSETGLPQSGSPRRAGVWNSMLFDPAASGRSMGSRDV